MQFLFWQRMWRLALQHTWSASYIWCPSNIWCPNPKILCMVSCDLTFCVPWEFKTSDLSRRWTFSSDKFVISSEFLSINIVFEEANNQSYHFLSGSEPRLFLQLLKHISCRKLTARSQSKLFLHFCKPFWPLAFHATRVTKPIHEEKNWDQYKVILFLTFSSFLSQMFLKYLMHSRDIEFICKVSFYPLNISWWWFPSFNNYISLITWCSRLEHNSLTKVAVWRTLSWKWAPLNIVEPTS